MNQLASMQPQEGDIVLHCAHALEADDSSLIFKLGTHWLSAEMPFTAPDGKRDIAQWFVCCGWCFRSIAGVAKRVIEIKVTGHVVWKKDGSCIAESFS